MKKLLILALALFAGVAAANAQDVLTKYTGEDIRVIVKEIDPLNIKYVLYEEPDGVIYIIPKSEVLIVRYASGRKEVFAGQNTTPAPAASVQAQGGYGGTTTSYGYNYGGVGIIHNNMKYNELKYIYDHRNWQGGYERYSPFWCGVGSFFIPGLGQIICGEVGRGFGHIGINLLCQTTSLLALGSGSAELYLVSALASLGFNIWSIVDAARVAKVKNMYETDLRSNYSSFSVDMYPSIGCVPQAGGYNVATGMTLAITF